MKRTLALLTIALLFTGAKSAGTKPVPAILEPALETPNRYEQIPALMDDISARLEASTNKLKTRNYETYKK